MDLPIVSFVNEGLGHSSHLVDLGDGTALVIDPARLPTAQRDYAIGAGLTIAFTADTHTHADYISGSPELAADGAAFLAPADAQLAHPYRGTRDGDVVPSAATAWRRSPRRATRLTISPICCATSRARSCCSPVAR